MCCEHVHRFDPRKLTPMPTDCQLFGVLPGQSVLELGARVCIRALHDILCGGSKARTARSPRHGQYNTRRLMWKLSRLGSWHRANGTSRERNWLWYPQPKASWQDNSHVLHVKAFALHSLKGAQLKNMQHFVLPKTDQGSQVGVRPLTVTQSF